MRVDLPEPFWPTSAWTSPLRTSKSTPSSAFVPGNVLLRPRISRTGGLAAISSLMCRVARMSLARGRRGGGRLRLAELAQRRAARERHRDDQRHALEDRLAPHRRRAGRQHEALDAEGEG